MWWALPVAMAGVGAVQGDAKRRQNERDAKAQAEVARWSPWSGMSPHQVAQDDSAWGGAMQGGVAGMGMIAGQKDDAATDAGPLGTPEQMEALSGGSQVTVSTPYERPAGAQYGNNTDGYSLGADNTPRTRRR